MTKKTMTLYIRDLNGDYMQIVREFAVHRRMSLKAMTLAAIDEYMTRHKEKERKHSKEVKPNATT